MTKPIGAARPHESAVLHVSGAAQYVDDLKLPADALHGALVLSSIAKGRIKSLAVEECLSAPGVVEVIRLNDVPGITDVGPVFPGDPLLTEQQISFYGQPICLVVARSELQARRAALSVRIDYEPEEPVLDIAGAAATGRRVRPPHTMLRGDPEDAFASSQCQLQGRLSIGGQEHLYIEGQVSVVLPTESGGMQVYCSTQNPSEVQKLVAEVLGLALHQVNVEVRRMGGGFGGKETQAAPWACLAAVAARKTRKAVKLRLPRAIDMQTTGKRHPFENQYRAGFNAAGQIQAVIYELNADCGHSPDLSDAIVDRAMFHADNAYQFPNVRVLGERWRTDKVSNTAFRGFGGPQGMLTCEAMMDDIARSVGRDPLDIRLDNLYPDAAAGGGLTPYHQSVSGDQLRTILRRLEAGCEYRSRRTEIREYNRSAGRYLRGLALTPVKFGISFTLKHLNQAGVLLNVYTDGSILISQAGTEMGQGLYTKVEQIVAAILGVSAEQVTSAATRTDKVPNTSPTAASSGADLNGMAARNAATKIKQRLLDYLAERENCAASEIIFSNGRVEWPTGACSFAQLVTAAYTACVSLSATGYYSTPSIWYDRKQARGRPFYYFANGAACSEVQIDRITGATKLLRVDILHDCGLSLNPAIDRGQIEGGFIQGYGWLTSEELQWDGNGRLLTASPATYKIPAISDAPQIFNVELLNEANSEATIYNSKAVGEPPLMLAISAWCAIRDAIASLADYRLSPALRAPATPENVTRAIAELCKDLDDAR